MYLAHRAEDGRKQSILEHDSNVAALCAAFAAPFGAEELGKEVELAHDIGKYSQAFQRRILGENIQTDHSTAGTQEIAKYFGWLAAYCVAGHHGGLPDGGGRTSSPSDSTLSGRLKRPVEPYQDFSREIQLERVRFRPPRGSDVTMDELVVKLENYVAPWWNAQSELNRIRCDILRACLEAGKIQAPGLFTLTVPTGGGKTISSLAFALRHAQAHGKKRIMSS